MPNGLLEALPPTFTAALNSVSEAESALAMSTLRKLLYTPGNKSAQISKANEAWCLMGSRFRVEEWTELLSVIAPFLPRQTFTFR